MRKELLSSKEPMPEAAGYASWGVLLATGLALGVFFIAVLWALSFE
jgi:hypothetical protein